MKKNKLIEIFLILIIIIATISYVPKEFQNDTFFTIAIGERIQKYGIEQEEKLAWHEGLRFTNPRWLFDLTISIIYDNFNFIGIYIFVIFFSVLLMCMYYYILCNLTNKKILSFVITILTITQMSNCFTGRALLISFNIFLLEYYLLEKMTTSDNYLKYMILLIILPFILVNVHSSVYPVYFVFMIPYFVEKLAYKLFNNYNLSVRIKDRKNILALFIVVLASLVARLCTPSGMAAFSYMFKVSSGISSGYIIELQNTNILYRLYFTFWIIIAIFLLSFTNVKVEISDLLFIVGFFWLSIYAIRCIFYFYLISTICISKLISEFLNEYNFEEIMKLYSKHTIIILFFIGIIILNNSISQIIDNVSKDYVDDNFYPVDATEYILENTDISAMKIYNGFDFGSYLEFKGIPVFLDSRSEVYTDDFKNDVTILNDLINTTKGMVTYKNTFEKYGITHALLYNDELINIYIMDDPDWKLLYKDNKFSFYENIAEK